MSQDTVKTAHLIGLPIIRPSDGAAEEYMAAVVQRVVNDLMTPAATASLITRIILKVNSERTIAFEDEDTMYMDTLGRYERMRASGWTWYLWDLVSRSSMFIPPGHAGQGQLTEFLKELQKLPKQTIEVIYNDGLKRCTELWTFNKGNEWAYFEHWLYTLDARLFLSYQLQQSRDRNTKFINFSAFLARLMTAGVVDTCRMCALACGDFFDYHPRSRSLHVEVYQTCVEVAAGWIVHAGPALYEMCKKRVIGRRENFRWTYERWESWMMRFQEVIDAEDRFSPRTKEIAEWAINAMYAIEDKGVTTNLAGTLGWTPEADEQSKAEAELCAGGLIICTIRVNSSPLQMQSI
ncbi:hypothetical protein K461DRAFT_314371 [Myriangium duriaei CBS 260.36]|uniref:Uncharacterized protein n=1 Tax=Myriangium duriaei CBS 260.36 TaxID=1168546 RepID=A0A9P4MET4_9PEZI|nr:hypothetical protein K461DRAFT_314371 [Myriangium duriaei CBS 260.36]